MIMAANYGDTIFTSVVKVTYFTCGNKKRLVPCHQAAHSFGKIGHKLQKC